MIQHLIWDVDGTLFDTYPAIARALQAALTDMGVAAPLDWILSLAQVTMITAYPPSSRLTPCPATIWKHASINIIEPSRPKISRPFLA
jgi:beta-phosphoglucomutase-like phosphatase (HAD superfamily)